MPAKGYRQATCKRGHSDWYVSPQGSRTCRVCKAERQQRELERLGPSARHDRVDPVERHALCGVCGTLVPVRRHRQDTKRNRGQFGKHNPDVPRHKCITRTNQDKDKPEYLHPQSTPRAVFCVVCWEPLEDVLEHYAEYRRGFRGFVGERGRRMHVECADTRNRDLGSLRRAETIAANPEVAKYHAESQQRRQGVYTPEMITLHGLAKRQGGRFCYLCLKPVRFGKGVARAKRGEIEHLIPLERGGRHEWDNCALACGECNLWKQDRTLEEAFARESYARTDYRQMLADGHVPYRKLKAEAA